MLFNMKPYLIIYCWTNSIQWMNLFSLKLSWIYLRCPGVLNHYRDSWLIALFHIKTDWVIAGYWSQKLRCSLSSSSSQSVPHHVIPRFLHQHLCCSAHLPLTFLPFTCSLLTSGPLIFELPPSAWKCNFKTLSFGSNWIGLYNLLIIKSYFFFF